MTTRSEAPLVNGREFIAVMEDHLAGNYDKAAERVAALARRAELGGHARFPAKADEIAARLRQRQAGEAEDGRSLPGAVVTITVAAS
ncbi:hypothetical protein AB0I28_32890 [Phytomonospora sp. NPDC050363]|uniref:hypothetical protein n=1 Tax=Phytomonospora sp. NPDC050363 TaxID=3155642 RepID=UPI003409D802